MYYILHTSLQQADQCPASLRALDTLERLPLSFIVEHGFIAEHYFISYELLVSLGQLCPLPASFGPSVNLLGAERRMEKSLMLCKCCSAIGKTYVCYQHNFSHKSKTQHHTSCCEKLTPFQPDPVHSVSQQIHEN